MLQALVLSPGQSWAEGQLLQMRGLHCSGLRACLPKEGNPSLLVCLWAALLSRVLWCYQRGFGPENTLVVQQTSGSWMSACCKMPIVRRLWGFPRLPLRAC